MADLLTRLRQNPDTGFYIVCFAFFVDYLLIALCVPILPFFAQDLGLTTVQLGFVFSCKSIAQVVSQPAAGYIVDRLGRRIPMLMGLILMSLSTVLFAFGANYAMLVAARFAQGTGSALNVTSGMALLTDLFAPEQRGKRMARAGSCLSLGVLCGAPVGGVLYSFGGKQFPFLFMAVLLVIDGLARMFLLAEPKSPEEVAADKAAAAADSAGASITADGDDGATKHLEATVDALAVADGMGPSNSLADGTKDEASVEATPVPPPLVDTRSSWEVYWSIVRDLEVMSLSISLLSSNGSIATTQVLVPLYMTNVLGFNATEVGLYYITAPIFYMTAVLVGPYIYPRPHVGRWRLMVVALLISTLANTVILVHPAALVFFTGFCLVGGGDGLLDSAINPELAHIAETRFPGHTGKVFAVSAIGNGVGYIVGPNLSSRVQETWGFQAGFASAGLLCFIMAAWLVCAVRGLRAPPAPTDFTTLEEEQVATEA